MRRWRGRERRLWDVFVDRVASVQEPKMGAEVPDGAGCDAEVQHADVLRRFLRHRVHPNAQQSVSGSSSAFEHRE